MERLDHFELKELIGQGGMARVYRALDTRLGREVALKLLDAGQTRGPRAAARFQREARLAAGLRHPNVVTVFECSPEGSEHWYVVTELVEGGSLRGWLERGLLAEEAGLLLLPVARALAAAHRQGIVHRDVKPENILVERGRDGATIKLADFGVAVALLEPRVTSDGGISGSLAYLAPELLRGEDVTPAADVWSFGVTFFELVHGRLPFAGVLAQALGDGEISIEAGRAPAPVANLLHACLRRDPRHRPADGAQLAATLEQTLVACGLEHLDQELGEWARRPDYAERLRPRLADRLVARASVEASLPARADLLDRALALVPDHPRALDLLEQRLPAPIPPPASSTTGGVLSASGAALRRPRRRAAGPLIGVLVIASVVGLGAAWLRSRRAGAPPAGVASKAPSGAGGAAPRRPTPDAGGSGHPDVGPVRSHASPAPGPSSRPTRPATLLLTSEPWAEVILDGRSLGHTPRLNRISLSPGERRLRLQNPLCRPELLRLQARSGDLLVRHVRLELLPARLSLRGPPGAGVVLDGRSLGALPLPTLDVEHGEHTLRLVDRDGRTRERRFSAVAGERLTLDLLEEQR